VLLSFIWRTNLVIAVIIIVIFIVCVQFKRVCKELTWDRKSSGDGDVIRVDSFLPRAAQKGSSADKDSRKPRLPLAAQKGSSAERDSRKPPLVPLFSSNSSSVRLPLEAQ
jgi:hypothetical protein